MGGYTVYTVFFEFFVSVRCICIDISLCFCFRPTALCTALLKRLGVTHVLNAAQGKMRKAGQVNTWPGFYTPSGIKFHGVEAFDNIVFRLYPYFEEAAQFIDDALTNTGTCIFSGLDPYLPQFPVKRRTAFSSLSLLFRRCAIVLASS